MKWVCVFCGSRPIQDQDFENSIKELSSGFLDQGWGMIYGGASVGIMGEMARSLLSKKGKVLGIIPEFLKTKELLQEGLTELVSVKTLEERKTAMIQRADAFLALPGGFGTLDELFEVVTQRQLGFHQKSVSLLNFKGYYDGLVKFSADAVQAGLITKKDLSITQVFSSSDQYLKYQQEYFKS